MRNYAGHRLAPWLAHVMVSRQETARALLTPGEVMQLPPSDELVLVAGTPPVRAQKLRYYEDRTFAARVLPPPVLASDGYADRPASRSDDWQGLVRAVDVRLATDMHNESDPESGGGLEQARHPAIDLERPVAPEPATSDPLGLGDDDGDVAADVRALDQAQSATARRVYALDAGTRHAGDLQLEL
jgi:type IV secretion system protein VirD4